MRLLMRQNFNSDRFNSSSTSSAIPTSGTTSTKPVYNVMPLLEKRLRSYELSRKPIPSTAIERKELD
jgi:hypothetical protein